jgi:hypothetical protein
MLGDLRQWHLLWLAPCAAGLHVIRRRAAVDRRLLFLCIVAGCYVSGLLLIYIISPWRDIALHIAVSFDRVALPLIPLFTMMITLAALDVRSDPHTFSHGDGRRQTGTPNLPDLE